MTEWPVVRLGDVVEIFDSRRIPLSSIERAARPGPYPYYGATSVMGHVDDYLFDGLYLLVGEDGSVETPLGKPVTQLVSGRFWVNNHAHVLRGRSDADTKYLAYALNSVQVRPFVSGSVQAKLSQANLRRILVPYPDTRTRGRVAGILGALDDKIELNRRTIETLEATVRAIFGRWFLREDASRDWPIEALSAHLDVVRGLSYKGDGLSSTGVPLHNLNSVYEGGGYKPDGIKWYSGPYADRHTVEPGEVIVTNTEQGHDRLLIGHAALVPKSFGELGLFSHHLYRVRPKPGSVLSRSFLAYLLNSPAMHDLVSGYSNGTTVQMLPVEGLQQPAIRVPPASLVGQFDALVTISQQREEIAREEAHALAMLRDALLPRLLSGSIGETA